MAGAQPLSQLPTAYGQLYRYLSIRWCLAFLMMNGLYAVRVDGLLQLLSLMALGSFAAAFCVAFKLCQNVLVEKLTCGKHKGP